MNTIFRLKFAYVKQTESGALKKAKLEVFVECSTYTEAETIAYAIAKDRQMGQFEPYTYEIVRTKFSAIDLIDNKTLQYDEKLIEHRIEHFFEGDNDAFFILKVKFLAEEEDGKDTTAQFIVSDTSTNNAVRFIEDHLKSLNYTNFIVTDSKLDPADCIYLTPESHQHLMNTADEA